MMTFVNLAGCILLGFEGDVSLTIASTIFNTLRLFFLSTVLIYSVFSIRKTVKSLSPARPKDGLICVHLINFVLTAVLTLSSSIIVFTVLHAANEIS